MVRYILKIEYILYKTESESDKYRKKYSFFYGINERERACQNTKMFARFLYEGNDDIIKKYELETSKYYSGDGDSPICERGFKYVEVEEK